MILHIPSVPPRTGSNYPEVFQSWVSGRVKQRLGDAAGLNNFGINLVYLAPGSCSALRHWHALQDEFIYVLSGEITLVTNAGEEQLQPGMAVGFPAGVADGHHLINRTRTEATYLEIGDRTPNDTVQYPDNDLVAEATPQGWQFTHKDGTFY